MVERRQRGWWERWGGVAVITTLLVEVLAAAFWLGRMDGRLGAVELQLEQLQRTLDAHVASVGERMK